MQPVNNETEASVLAACYRLLLRLPPHETHPQAGDWNEQSVPLGDQNLSATAQPTGADHRTTEEALP